MAEVGEGRLSSMEDAWTGTISDESAINCFMMSYFQEIIFVFIEYA